MLILRNEMSSGGGGGRSSSSSSSSGSGSGSASRSSSRRKIIKQSEVGVKGGRDC